MALTRNLLLISLATGITACSSSNDTTSANPSDPDTILAAGRVADGYLTGATLCLDKNNNMACDNDEPSDVSDPTGSFTLKATEVELAQYAIVAEIPTGAIDLDDDQEAIQQAYTLVAPPGKYAFVSPITTLITQSVGGDYSAESLAAAERAIGEKLGLDGDTDLYIDFIVQEQSAGASSEAYAKIHRTAQLTARMLGSSLTSLRGDETQLANANQLLVAAMTVIDNLEQLSELAAPADGFDADAIAESNKLQWQASTTETLGGNDVDSVAETLKAQLAFPQLNVGGVYAYTAADGSQSDILKLVFDTNPTSLLTDYTITVNGPAGYSYTFVPQDLISKDANTAELKKVIKDPDAVLSEGLYQFTVRASGSAAESAVTLIEDNHITTTDLPEFSAATITIDGGESGFMLAQRPYDNAYTAYWPVTDDRLYYAAEVFDANGDLIGSNSFKLGRNHVWLDKAFEPAAGMTMSVYVADAPDPVDRTHVRELVSADLLMSQSAASLYFERSYFRQAPWYSDPRTIFQFGVQPIDKIGRVTIERFDQTAYVPVLDQLIDHAQLVSKGDGYGGLIWNEYVVLGGTPTLDGFYQIEDSMPSGIYRYTLTDTIGETLVTYDYLGDYSASFPRLTVSDLAPQLAGGSRWLEVKHNPQSDYAGDLYYRVQFNLDYKQEDGDNIRGHLFTFPATDQPSSFVDIDWLKTKIDRFKLDYNTDTVYDITVDVSTWDGKRSENVDNRVESGELQLSPIVPQLTTLLGLKNSTTAAEMLGTWRSTTTENELLVVSFFDDGTYMYGVVDTEDLAVSGMEWGTYAYDQSSGELTSTQTFDANGGRGISESITHTAEVNGTILTLNFHDSSNSIVTVDFEKTSSDGLLGTWLVLGTENDFFMFNFFDDGTYVHAEVDFDDPNEISGMEWGTYAVDLTTGRMTITQTFDNNGDTGMTDIANGTASAFVQVSGDVATFSFDDDNNGSIDGALSVTRQ